MSLMNETAARERAGVRFSCWLELCQWEAPCPGILACCHRRLNKRGPSSTFRSNLLEIYIEQVTTHSQEGLNTLPRVVNSNT